MRRLIFEHLWGDELLRKLVQGSGSAAAIKIASAGLSILSFLALAQVLGAAEYGRFGFAFSAATVLAVAFSMGQRLVAIKYAANYSSNQNSRLLAGLIRHGYKYVFSGVVVGGAVFLPIGTALLPSESAIFVGLTLLLAAALAIAEFQSFLLRGMGSLAYALLPRDVIWRGAIICFAAAVIYYAKELRAEDALLFVAGALIFLVTLQGLGADRIRVALKGSVERNTNEWRLAGFPFWGTTVIQATAPNIAVLLIGITLSPSDSGAFFSVQRVAQAQTILLLAANIVAAPLLAKKFGEGDLSGAQRICRFVAVASALPVGIALLINIVAGDEILALFDESYEKDVALLWVLSIGCAFNALTGPCSALLEMGGQERSSFRIQLWANVAMLFAMPFFLVGAGPMGAAICIATGLATANILAAFRAWSVLGIDPSILSLLHRRTVTHPGLRKLPIQ